MKPTNNPYEPGTSRSSIDALTRRRQVRCQDQSRRDMPMSAIRGPRARCRIHGGLSTGAPKDPGTVTTLTAHTPPKRSRNVVGSGRWSPTRVNGSNNEQQKGPRRRYGEPGRPRSESACIASIPICQNPAHQFGQHQDWWNRLKAALVQHRVIS